MKKIIFGKRFVVVFIVSILLTLLGMLFGVDCTISDTGGVREGFQGVPLPHYSCGVWGEASSVWVLPINFLIVYGIVFGLSGLGSTVHIGYAIAIWLFLFEATSRFTFSLLLLGLLYLIYLGTTTFFVRRVSKQNVVEEKDGE